MKTEKTEPNNPQAFPNTWTNENGMTLRDYFANSAMQSLIINLNNNVKDGTTSAIYFNNDFIAKDAYELADAMLKQREL